MQVHSYNPFGTVLSVRMGETLKHASDTQKASLVGDGQLEKSVAKRVNDSFEPGATSLADLNDFVTLENQLSKKLVPYHRPDGTQPKRIGSKAQAEARNRVNDDLKTATAALPGEGWEAGSLHLFNDGLGYTMDFTRESAGVQQRVSVAHNTDWPDDKGNAVYFSSKFQDNNRVIEQVLTGDIESATGKISPYSETLFIDSAS